MAPAAWGPVWGPRAEPLQAALSREGAAAARPRVVVPADSLRAASSRAAQVPPVAELRAVAESQAVAESRTPVWPRRVGESRAPAWGSVSRRR